ncbi:glycosyltransferase, partial [Enterococcus faecalis]
AMPVYNVEEKWLRLCIDSILNQVYTNWELCMADDASTDPNVKKILTEYQQLDERIRVVFREQNGHISEATNSALAIATGEFVALLDNDDELAINAFYEVVKVLNENPKLDLIYSDEDKIDMDGNRSDPAFKPDWSP